MKSGIEIIYVYDPMCGWCYAFSEAINKAQENYGDLFSFRIMSGGMMLAEREGPVGNFANYILGAIPRVESMSGVQFGPEYKRQLQDQTLYLSSLMPSVALELVKQQSPEKSFPFAAAMQKAHFYDGKNLSNRETYISLAKSFGFEPEWFIANLETPEAAAMAGASFQWSHNTGVQGYPAVLIHLKNQYYRLSNGYVPYQELEQGLEQLKQLL